MAVSEGTAMGPRREVAPCESDWERAETSARYEHVMRLMGRGASMADAAEAVGVSYGAFKRWMQRRKA